MGTRMSNVQQPFQKTNVLHIETALHQCNFKLISKLFPVEIPCSNIECLHIILSFNILNHESFYSSYVLQFPQIVVPFVAHRKECLLRFIQLNQSDRYFILLFKYWMYGLVPLYYCRQSTNHLLSTATTQITRNFNAANIYSKMRVKINEVKDSVSNCCKVYFA